jgi:1-deoxy-D-xylulose-5-phosphate synthase
MNLLDSINTPKDLKKLSLSELPQLCDEIRTYMIHTLSQVGGHLSSNLGTVELSVALHYVYNSPVDKFIWDVGHQTYTHKILTGRKNQLNTIRRTNGLSGFPKKDESEHDHYNSGHAGTSISLALGEAVGRDLKNAKRKPHVISIIGDASIATGMSFEAMNHAGHLKTPFLVILNDNDMSISKSVGGLSYILTSMISTRFYKGWVRRWVKFLRWVPLGIIIERFMMRFGSNMKSIMTEHQFFEELGFRYLGPLDGHDVTKLVNMFKKLRFIERPILLHVVTKKGKGYKHAEDDPTLFHGIAPFEKSTGALKSNHEDVSLSELVGKTLKTLAVKNKKILAITPAMKEGSGLSVFADAFADRFFDTGISEQHAATFSAALASSGYEPFLCIYSTFLQRSYDQVIHDIALMNLPVKLVIDRAGVVGGDGETHQGLYDIAYLNAIPNMTLISPSDPQDLADMLSYMETFNKGPIALRFPRSVISKNTLGEISPSAKTDVNSKLVRKGGNAIIFCEGFMTANALKAADILKKENISLEVVAIRSLKPLDKKSLSRFLKNKKYVFTLENHSVISGIGSIIECEMANQIHDVYFHKFGYPDKFIEHGSISDIEKIYKLDGNSIADFISQVINSDVKTPKKAASF